MFNKNAIGPVVATALLLVVAVVGVVSFQGWFTTYNSGLFTNAEVQSNSASNNPIEIDRLIGDTLYIINNNQNNLSIDKVEIDNNDCNLNQNLTSGMNKINVSSCLENVTSVTPDVVVFTDESVLSKSFYVENDVVGDQDITVRVVETDGNFELLSNGIVTCSGSSVGDTATLDGTTYTAVSNQNLSDEIGSNNISFYETACTSLVTDMNLADSNTGGVFYDANINPDISHWDTSSVTDMKYMFRDASNFNQPLSFDTSSVTDMSFMFWIASSFNQSLDFDTSSVTNMSGMFSATYDFNQPLSFDTSSVTDMSSMFIYASSFNQSLDFDTSSVTNMDAIFRSASSFDQPLDFETSNVRYISRMFWDASSFNQPLNFNTTNVVDMSLIFSGASSFNQPLNFETNNVTDMSNMFRYATNFNQSLSFDTSSVTDMGNMFSGATNFNQPLSFDTRSVLNMGVMFFNAESFNQSLNFNTSGVTNMFYMFNGATSFDQNLTSWCVTNIETEPDDFAKNSPINDTGLKPDWGNCP